MISRWTMTWLLLMTIGASGGLAGCGTDEPSQSPAPETAESGVEAQVPAGAEIKMPPLPLVHGENTITSELSVKTELPDFYPADAPVYPNTPPSKSFVKGDRINLVFGTPDSVEQVVGFLEDELPRLGWTNASTQRMSNIVSMEATKSSRDLTIVISRFQGEPADSTMIAVSVTAD